MRRQEREIRDISVIYGILQRCRVLRLGLNGEDGLPYVLPLNFGCELKDGRITLYFHSAGAGRKWEILQEDPRVCAEADVFGGTFRRTERDISARYESVIGWGTAERITDPAEKIRALKIILDRTGDGDFLPENCGSLPQTEVFRLALDKVTGKSNPPKENA